MKIFLLNDGVSCKKRFLVVKILLIVGQYEILFVHLHT